MKRWSIFLGSLFILFTTACGTTNPTQTAAQPSQGSAAATTTTAAPSSTFTPTLELPTPTATAAPANFRSDNFFEFAQIRSFYDEIEAVVGGDPLNMSLDAVAFSRDGRYAALGGCTGQQSGSCQSDVFVSDSFLFILDTLTGDLVANLPETDTTIASLAFTPDGDQLVYATRPVRIIVWDIPSGQVERVIVQEPSTYESPSLSVSPDGSQIAAAYAGSLRIWDAASGAEITQQPGNRSGLVLPQYSADGSRLAVFMRDDGSEIAVYDTVNWERIALIQLPYETRRAALSPDGTTLVTIEDTFGADVLFWDVGTSAQSGSLGASFDFANSLTFSPDGELLLVTSLPPEDDLYGGITVWQVATRQMLGSMPNLLPPRRILFSADGTSLLFVDYTFPLVYRWALPDANILAVRQAVFNFLAALQDGDYEGAAKLLQPYEEDLLYYESLGLDSDNLPAVLEYICNQSSQPCSVAGDEILFEGMELDGSYSLMMSFTRPDGSPMVDETGYDAFWFYASLDDTGSATVSLLPSFLYPQ